MRGLCFDYLSKFSFFFISRENRIRITPDIIQQSAIVSGALSQRPVSPSDCKLRINIIGKINALPTEMNVAQNDFSTAVI